MKLRLTPVFFLFPVIVAIGCGGSGKGDASKERLEQMSGGTLKPVVPVSGTVLIDDAPAAGVILYLHPAEGGPSLRETRTDKEGKYCWNTYTPCDGIEPGSYRLGFRHVLKPEKRPGSGDDQFKGRYKDPKKSDFTLTVEAGSEPMKDVNYELKSK